MTWAELRRRILADRAETLLKRRGYLTDGYGHVVRVRVLPGNEQLRRQVSRAISIAARPAMVNNSLAADVAETKTGTDK